MGPGLSRGPRFLGCAMRGKLVVGDWKMNGGLRQNDALLAELRARWAAPGRRDLAVCVPYPYLWQAQSALSGSAISWGAQNVSEHAGGAYTGEVSAAMVAEFGCRFALVGHSERRARCGETDAAVADKAAAALGAGLTPVVCVGETLAEREAGATGTVVSRQFDAVADPAWQPGGAIVIAYEPVWAIGTGRTASPEQAQAVHRLLRDRLGGIDGGGGGAAALRWQRQAGQRQGAVRMPGYRRCLGRRCVTQGR